MRISSKLQPGPTLVLTLLLAPVSLACAPEATPITAALESSGSQSGSQSDSQSTAETFGLPNEKAPGEGLVFGGQPTEDQLRRAAERGFRVVNLRMPSEDAGFDEAALAHEVGIDYRPIPVNGPALEDPATYQQFYQALEDGQGPVLVHCASGNRVGALYYAYLVEREGVEPAEALTRAQANGLRSEELAATVGRYLESRP